MGTFMIYESAQYLQTYRYEDQISITILIHDLNAKHEVQILNRL